ncbi:MAG: hypothetical protein QNJ40_12135 [Xanthomonadales bacterium]|nr:hypothetical protein [Xanthomonadales bacterium]
MRTFISRHLIFGIAGLALASSNPVNAAALFVYQGRLLESGVAANGVFDFELELFDAVETGSSLSPALTLPAQTVESGLVSLPLDAMSLPAEMDGLWVELRVRAQGAPGFTTLLPRQRFESTPTAIVALGAAPDSVDGESIVDRSVGRADLGIGAAGSVTIGDNAVTGSTLAADSVTASAIASGTVGSAQIADNAVTGMLFQVSSITAAGVAENTVGASAVANGSVTSQKIAPGSVVSTKIPENAINGSRIASGAVTSAKIQAASIGASQINSSQVQRRIQQSCTGGMISQINQDGTVTCEPDSVGIGAFGPPVQTFVSSVNGQGAVSQVIGALSERFCVLSLVEKTDVDGTNEIGKCQLVNAGPWVLQATTSEDATVTCGAVCFPYQ